MSGKNGERRTARSASSASAIATDPTISAIATTTGVATRARAPLSAGPTISTITAGSPFTTISSRASFNAHFDQIDVAIEHHQRHRCPTMGAAMAGLAGASTSSTASPGSSPMIARHRGALASGAPASSTSGTGLPHRPGGPVLTDPFPTVELARRRSPLAVGPIVAPLTGLSIGTIALRTAAASTEDTGLRILAR